MDPSPPRLIQNTIAHGGYVLPGTFLAMSAYRRTLGVKNFGIAAGVLGASNLFLKAWERVENRWNAGDREALAKKYSEAYGAEWLASVSNVGFPLGEIRHLKNKFYVLDHHAHDDHHAEAH